RGAIAIGNFDGVHVGHRALFLTARGAAAQHGGPACALTFEPHPAQVLAPQYAPPLISSPLRQRELMAEAGVEDAVVQRFDREFARTEAGDFVERLLATGVSEVVVGQDFTYGRDRKGDVHTLEAALAARGVRLHLVPPITVGGMVASS